MQKYQITYNPENSTEDNFEGIYGISLVGEAANGFKFIAMNKQDKAEIKLADVEKRIIASPVLVPDQEIYRDWDGGSLVSFNEEVIRNASQEFMKNGYHTNSTIDHKGDFLKGITVVENWIVEDSNMDKAKHYGFDVPVGTWMAVMKVDNDEVWAKVKSGEVTGVSIDSYFGIEKIYEDVKLQINNKNKTKNKMKKKTLMERIAGLFAEEVKLMEIEVAEYGRLFADSWEVGSTVLKVDTNEPLVDAEFEHEGYKYTTDAEGVISSKEEVIVVEEAVVEMAKQVSQLVLSQLRKELKLDAVEEAVAVVEDRTDELVDVLDEAREDIADNDIAELKNRINELEGIIDTMKQETEKIKSENVALKKVTPAGSSLEVVKMRTDYPTGSKAERRAKLYANL